MEPIVFWQQKWGLSFNIPWYLFLGGLAGGTLTIAALADLLAGARGHCRDLARMAAYVTVPAILIGGLSLTFHLGKPERGFAFPLFFTNYHSWLTIGGWIIGAFAPLSLAYAAAWYFNFGRRLRLTLAAIGVPLGVLMALYTGFLLSAAWAVPGGRWFVPLWDNRFLPVLFLLSGLSTALAASGLALLAAGRRGPRGAGAAPYDESWATAKAASWAGMAAIFAEGTWVYLFLASLAAGTLGQQLVFDLVVRGGLAPWFWGGFVATGLVAPLLAAIVQAAGERLLRVKLPWLMYAKFVLVLIGGLVLRYIIVWGGDMKTPLAFPPSMWPVPSIQALPPLPGLGG